MNNEESSRPEAAFVLMLMQSTFWGAAGISSLPFVLAGEPYMLLLASLTFGLAALGLGLAAGVVMRRRGARRATLILECVCLGGAALQQVLPIGANHGSVSLLVNLVLPAAVVLLLRGSRMRARFGITAPQPR
jgi:hypothetical protein